MNIEESGTQMAIPFLFIRPDKGHFQLIISQSAEYPSGCAHHTYHPLQHKILLQEHDNWWWKGVVPLLHTQKYASGGELWMEFSLLCVPAWVQYWKQRNRGSKLLDLSVLHYLSSWKGTHRACWNKTGSNNNSTFPIRDTGSLLIFSFSATSLQSFAEGKTYESEHSAHSHDPILVSDNGRHWRNSQLG